VALPAPRDEFVLSAGLHLTTDLEVLMFAIIGKWRVDEALDSEQLAHIAANVRQQPGFVRGYWGQDTDDVSFAHAVVILDDEASAQTMAEGVKAAIPSAELLVVQVLADAANARSD
jgi:hypothetical protein